MRILGRLLRQDPDVGAQLEKIHDRIDESDDRLDEARRLNEAAAARLELVEARVRLRRETLA